jgi:HAD hydrolase, family IA, variant 3
MTAGERSDNRDGPRRAVLWDLDGTLIASQPLWDASFTRLCEAARGRVTRKILGLLAGQSIAGTLELIAATGAAPAASSPRARAILDAMNDEVIALVAADPPLVPGARELVAAVAARGAAQAIVSASQHRMVAAVAGVLDGAINVLVTGDDAVPAKPDPAPYALAARRLGVPAARCVVVEDSITGLGSARAGGLRTFQIGSVPLLPDDGGVTLVPSLTELDADRLLGPAERRY